MPSKDLYVDTWRALEKIKRNGLARSIGVSNFPAAQIERLIVETDTVPAVNQVELHPRLAQTELRDFDARHGIATQAWSPLGHGQLLSDSTVNEIAVRHGKTSAQILLRWNLELGNVVISKSVTPGRIRSNMEIFDFELTHDDHDLLATLDTRHLHLHSHRTRPHRLRDGVSARQTCWMAAGWDFQSPQHASRQLA